MSMLQEVIRDCVHALRMVTNSKHASGYNQILQTHYIALLKIPSIITRIQISASTFVLYIVPLKITRGRFDISFTKNHYKGQFKRSDEKETWKREWSTKKKVRWKASLKMLWSTNCCLQGPTCWAQEDHSHSLSLYLWRHPWLPPTLDFEQICLCQSLLHDVGNGISSLQ